VIYIELIDFKGDFIRMTFAGTPWKRSRKGLLETWVYVDQDWNDKFSILPAPLFSEWFE